MGMSLAWKDWHVRKEGTVEPETGRLEELLGEPTGKRILDIGCGTGRHAIHFARMGFEVDGFDEDEDVVDRAKRFLERENLKAHLRVWDMTNPFPYENSMFDAVVAARVIHHTYAENIARIAVEIDRVLKQDGFLFLQVPAYETQTFDSGTNWAEPGTLIARAGPEKGVLHHFFRREELVELFPGFSVEKIHSNSEHYGGYCLIARKQRITV